MTRLSTPALRVWWAELRQGKRTVTTVDALWRAACWEQSALSAARQGFHDSARRDLREARKLWAGDSPGPALRPARRRRLRWEGGAIR